MSNPPLKRSSLTEHLVSVAQSLPFPVGRGNAPRGGGWTGQMSASDYVDYVVIKAGQATAPASGEPVRLGVQHTSWDALFQIIGHGETESRCDVAAHDASALLLDVKGPVNLDGVVWQVQIVDIPRMGETQWSNQDKAWRVTYDVSVHLSRQRTR